MNDFWAYRLESERRNWFFPIAISEVARRLDAANKASNIDIPVCTRDTLKLELAKVKKMFEALGWHGTVSGEVLCFGLPTIEGWRIGYIIVETTSAKIFLASPVPLTYLDSAVDYDAKVSSEQVRNVAGQLLGKTDTKVLTIATWRRSAKGNLYTKINGAGVTVFPDARNDGYKAIIASGDDTRKIFTKACKDEKEAIAYVVENFHELTRSWSGAQGIVDDADDDDGQGWGLVFR